MWFEKIKCYYDSGAWTKIMVRNAVAKGKITADEYRMITKEDY